MFERMLSWLRKTLPSMFDTDDMADIVISSKMERAIGRWVAEYEGRPPWANKSVKSIGLPAAIASEIAKMATMEAKITVSGSNRGDFLNEQLSPLLLEIQNKVELAAGLGGVVFKPFVCDDRIIIDTVQGDCFFPTSFDTSGRMTGCIFVDQFLRKNKVYTRLERHDYCAGTHRIQNKAFVSSNTTSIGYEISLDSVPEWAQIADDLSFENVTQPLFSYFKMPITNKIDRFSPLGVPIFVNAEKLIRDADEQYGRYIWEFEGGELAIDASEDYLKHMQTGQLSLPKGKERLFRSLNTKDPNFYQAYAPALREESICSGYNTILRQIEFNIGVEHGTISDPQTVEKTAEEIRAGKQRTYATITGIQKMLRLSIESLTYAMDALATKYRLAPSGSYEISFDWDDSILNDPQQRKQQFWQYVQSGKFPMWRYLVLHEGFTEKEAKEIEAETTTNIENPFQFGES